MPDQTPDEAAASSPHAAASLLVAAARLDATLYPAAQEVQDALIALERERDSLRAQMAAQQPVIDAAEAWVRAGRARFATVPAGPYATSLIDAVEADTPAEPNDEFGTTCIDCGKAITDEDDTYATSTGDLLHVDCGEPCVCGTDFTCLAHDHEEDREVAGTPAAEPVPDDVLSRVKLLRAEEVAWARELATALDAEKPRDWQNPMHGEWSIALGRVDACNAVLGFFGLTVEDIRALTGADTPTEPADNTQETAP